MAVATVSNTAPSNPAAGALWLDTAGVEDVLRVWTGTAWTGASDSTTGGRHNRTVGLDDGSAGRPDGH